MRNNDRKHIHDKSQFRAITNLSQFEHRISALVGRAGHGKTYTVKRFYDVLANIIPPEKIYFFAPTGKAAKVLDDEFRDDSIELINRPMTIHMGLGCQGAGWLYNSENKLDARYIILDESSMIDSSLMARLLSSIPDKCRILLVGDPEQLLPVGAGCPFRDLINAKSGTDQVNELTTCHRQKQGSLIAHAGEQIRRGKAIIYGTEGKHTLGGERIDDLFISQHNDKSTIIDDLCEIIAQWFSNRKDFVVLAPQRTGDVGINNLNANIQAELNHGGKGLKVNDNLELRVGDRVKQTANNYKLNVFNGFVGTIIDIVDKSVVVDFDGQIVEYNEMKDIFDLTLGYATTIHSSQGSGYKYGVIVADKSHSYMWNRQLAYVAVTRFKEKCVIVGQKTTMARAVMKNESRKRNTLLGLWLKNNCKIGN